MVECQLLLTHLNKDKVNVITCDMRDFFLAENDNQSKTSFNFEFVDSKKCLHLRRK